MVIPGNPSPSILPQHNPHTGLKLTGEFKGHKISQKPKKDDIANNLLHSVVRDKKQIESNQQFQKSHQLKALAFRNTNLYFYNLSKKDYFNNANELMKVMQDLLKTLKETKETPEIRDNIIDLGEAITSLDKEISELLSLEKSFQELKTEGGEISFATHELSEEFLNKLNPDDLNNLNKLKTSINTKSIQLLDMINHLNKSTELDVSELKNRTLNVINKFKNEEVEESDFWNTVLKVILVVTGLFLFVLAYEGVQYLVSSPATPRITEEDSRKDINDNLEDEDIFDNNSSPLEQVKSEEETYNDGKSEPLKDEPTPPRRAY